MLYVLEIFIIRKIFAFGCYYALTSEHMSQFTIVFDWAQLSGMTSIFSVGLQLRWIILENVIHQDFDQRFRIVDFFFLNFLLNSVFKPNSIFNFNPRFSEAALILLIFIYSYFSILFRNQLNNFNLYELELLQQLTCSIFWFDYYLPMHNIMWPTIVICVFFHFLHAGDLKWIWPTRSAWARIAVRSHAAALRIVDIVPVRIRVAVWPGVAARWYVSAIWALMIRLLYYITISIGCVWKAWCPCFRCLSCCYNEYGWLFQKKLIEWENMQRTSIWNG